MMSLVIHGLRAGSISMPHRSMCVVLMPLALRMTASRTSDTYTDVVSKVRSTSTPAVPIAQGTVVGDGETWSGRATYWFAL
jgi:hypothetical protein